MSVSTVMNSLRCWRACALSFCLLAAACTTVPEPAPPPVPEVIPALAPEPVVEAIEVPPPPPPEPDPNELVDMSGEAVASLLGSPALLRRELEVEVWRYSSPLCIFHVFLYADDAGPGHRVTHFEATGPDALPVDARECYGSLIEGDADE